MPTTSSGTVGAENGALKGEGRSRGPWGNSAPTIGPFTPALFHVVGREQ